MDLTYLKEGICVTADPHLEVAQMEHVDFVHPLYILRGEKECPSSESEAGQTRLFKETGLFTTFV